MDWEEFERWLESAKTTLASAEHDLKGGFYNWACFKAQQASEMALKALLSALGILPQVHSVYRLYLILKEELPIKIPENILKKLDKYYIPTRYPDVFPDSTPSELFSKEEAEEAIEGAELVIKEVEEVALELKKENPRKA